MLFYFILKVLFILKIFKFLSWLFVENGLARKIGLISKFMTSQPGKQLIAIHILLNISRSRAKQTMKFGQLMEYNMKTFFLKNHIQNVLEELFPDSLLKNQDWEYLRINSLKFNTVSFNCMPSWRLSKDIETKL